MNPLTVKVRGMLSAAIVASMAMLGYAAYRAGIRSRKEEVFNFNGKLGGTMLGVMV